MKSNEQLKPAVFVIFGGTGDLPRTADSSTHDLRHHPHA